MLSSEGTVLYERIVDATECEVDFRHSYNKGLIREVYRVDPDNRLITLERSYNQSFGAGMLDTVDDTQDMNFHQEGDYYVMEFAPNWQKEIHYIGGNIARHTFVYGDDIVSIGDLRPKKPFTLSVNRRSIYQRLMKMTN